MDLNQRVSNAYRTGGVNVESYEDERTMVVFSVFADILALHCSHVRAKRDWRAQSGAGTQPSDLSVDYHALKSPISDGSLIAVRGIGVVGIGLW